ncbi:two-component sensor histidine kinase [Streptomyces sp. SID8360]|nr:integral membrane sensor signal transduction histidine kinase [Streptomyces sp. SirexAA-E]MYR69539.1 two-component sensor histidine kinase [Streptomyces sp. SID4939]MYS01679.1 two-component sensor histidine kinase [Streptomyces sp. SID4940]MYT66246.1 two-component sensor histidine kinase [Streptomyces sp. SID8357]MYT83166.1 two-component sensor histidine kinase [Streptomyces sp. SID8360]MYW36101.1 two-component sensor histidine kinase [Streptomyces sp. SID1]PZX42958.1 histidine kinase [Str
MARMRRILRPLALPATYSRWLHLLIPGTAVSVWLFINMDTPWVPMVVAVPVGLIPAVRLAEGVQAQHLLRPEERGHPGAAISTAPSATWSDRWRTVVWLEVRLLLTAAVGFATVFLSATTVDLVRGALGSQPSDEWLARGIQAGWWCAPLALVPIVLLLCVVVAGGDLVTAVARQLLGPSATERMTALEERTERLLERNRMARELHDSIGHALTIAVVQAGAARAAGDAVFTARALAAIEETGRHALDDLERVLKVLRESDSPVSARPTLAEADRLLDSARDSGADVDAEVSGALTLVPGPVSREGYRILQEALTNVLRHAGSVPVRVRIGVAGGWLELEIVNPLPASVRGSGGGSGLRGIRERAALLGGSSEAGPREGQWTVRVKLPLDRIR